ncbi:MAG: hypothetical protein EHM59_16605 [Betaproteobacteria bacterium]|nr:MAG: hypothetical protein EHM59_16605 [Betaproteobacteria bacterium]
MDIGRLHEAISVLDELIRAVGQLPADESEIDGIIRSFTGARANLDRLVQHYAQLCSFPDALWTTAMEGGAPAAEASAETAMLLKWLADNQDKD